MQQQDKQPGAGGRLYVVKIGGNVIDTPEALETFLDDFASVDGPKILVHGGGKIASKLGAQLGIVSRYVDGRRITDADTLNLVTMVYGGLINKRVVAALQGRGCNAIGLTGADGNVIPAVKRPAGEVDFGFVGDIRAETIQGSLLEDLLTRGLTPVLAPLTHDSQGQMLNTNADTIASAVAIALSRAYQVRLIYCFDKKGVLRSLDDEKDVVHHLNRTVYRELLETKALADGILPKLDNAFDAIERGVTEVLIGRASDLRDNLAGPVAGTLVTL